MAASFLIERTPVAGDGVTWDLDTAFGSVCEDASSLPTHPQDVTFGHHPPSYDRNLVINNYSLIDAGRQLLI